MQFHLFRLQMLLSKIKEQVVSPTMKGLQQDRIPTGFVFIGLIKVGENPKVIEYNVRMGDPETQVIAANSK